MKNYEGLFLADSRKANRDWDAVAGHVRHIIERAGGTLVSLEKWAERKLAYPVKKHTRGVYILTYFQTPDETENAVAEIQRQVEISDLLLRAMILRIKRLPEKPAPEEAPAAEEAEAAPEPSEGAATEGEENEEVAAEASDEA